MLCLPHLQPLFQILDIDVEFEADDGVLIERDDDHHNDDQDRWADRLAA